MGDMEDSATHPVPAIRVKDVCFSYGSSEVLHNVSFEIPEKAFVAVVGPNGGGKTTLLRLLLGEMEPRYGSIEVMGKPPRDARRRVGVVPQSVAFDPDFPITVREAVLTGLVDSHLFGGFRASEREAADRALEKVGLAGFGDRSFSELSGGERQRVVVAGALVADPALLLLDEPTANVDHATELGLMDLFHSLSEERTVLLVSHNLSVVAARATHLLCINRAVDLHRVGSDEEARLEPLPGHGSLAFVHNLNPEHIEHLVHALETPHHGHSEK